MPSDSERAPFEVHVVVVVGDGIVHAIGRSFTFIAICYVHEFSLSVTALFFTPLSLSLFVFFCCCCCWIQSFLVSFECTISCHHLPSISLFSGRTVYSMRLCLCSESKLLLPLNFNSHGVNNTFDKWTKITKQKEFRPELVDHNAAICVVLWPKWECMCVCVLAAAIVLLTSNPTVLSDH